MNAESRVSRLALASAFLLFVTMNPALAESDEGSGEAGSRALERILIIGSAMRFDAIPGSAHSIDREQLDRYSHGDIHRILQTIPGVNIHEEEGFGLFPNIGLRGTRLERNSRITVMEDGVLIAPAPYAAPAAYYFPQTGRMDRVEVRKGTAAIQYGPYTTGGAINLLSTPIPEEFSGKADLLGGRFGGRRAHANIGGQQGQWGWLVEGYHSASDGFKRLDTSTDSSLPNRASPSTGFEADNVLAKLRWSGNGGGVYQEIELKLALDDKVADETYLGLTLDDFHADPFRRYAGSALDQIDTRHEQVHLRHFIMPTASIDITTDIYNMDFARNWYKLHAVQNAPGGGFVGISAILDNPEGFATAFDWIQGESDTGVLGNVRANNREYYSRGIHSRLNWSFDIGGVEHEMEIGLRYHRDQEDRLQWQDSFRMINGSMVLVRPGQEVGQEGRAETGIPGSTSNRITEAEAWALSLYNTMRIGDWTLSPGFRVEDITLTRRDFFEGENPSRDSERRRSRQGTTVILPGVGATYGLNDRVTLLAGVHRGFAPTGIGSDEEKSWNYEAGARLREGALTGSLIGFHTRYSNLVGVCTAASGGGCEVGEEFNGGRVNVSGIEFELAYDLGARFELPVGVPLSLSYTWTESSFRTAFDSDFAEWGNVERGDELPQIPPHQLNAGLGLVGERFQTHLNINYVDTTRAVAGSGPIPENERVDSRVLLDLSAEYRVHANASLFASVENLTDETYLVAFRPAGARPGLPRTFWGGVKLSF